MPVRIAAEPELVAPNASHWLNLETTSRRRQEPFSNEEVYPILELDVPRVGVVRAQFSATRYVTSSYAEGSMESIPVWTPWNVYLKEVRTPDEDRPDLPHLGKPAAGIGEATRAAIRDACLPIIHEWLASEQYLASRRQAARSAVVREIDAPADDRIRQARETVLLLEAMLGSNETDELVSALDHLTRARTILDHSGDKEVVGG